MSMLLFQFVPPSPSPAESTTLFSTRFIRTIFSRFHIYASKHNTCFSLSDLIHSVRVSLMAQMVKNLPVRQKTWVQSLGQEDHLKEEMATHCSSLAWRIPGTAEPAELPSMGSHRVGHD